LDRVGEETAQVRVELDKAKSLLWILMYYQPMQLAFFEWKSPPLDRYLI
jgi:hypothetical protein